MEEENRYIKTRERIKRFLGNWNISDKDIIEFLDKEIEQYRERIEQQSRIIDNLSKMKIQDEETILDATEDELINKDIVEIIETTKYADGKPIVSETKYRYKDNYER